MKKYIYQLLAVLFAVFLAVSCTVDEGTTPGTDSDPVITIYQYTPELPYNSDNDVILRFAANSKTDEAYYLVEPTKDKNSHVASMGESGYNDYVVSNGNKLTEISGESDEDVTITDLFGSYTISAVAVNGSKKTRSEVSFLGLDWEDVVSGVYWYGASPSIINSNDLTYSETTLQVCTTDWTLYRFKDVFGEGYSLKINLIDYWGKDSYGEYQFFRIPEAQVTPFLYGNYGTVWVRDIGYWQGSDSYITEGGYESGIYWDNYYCFICIQYYVSAGSCGYGYDEFEPY